VGCALAYWAYQTFGPELIQWAKAQQQATQRELAGSIQAIRRGTDPWALWALLGGCFVYGVVHAIGPGHGKVLIGGAAFASRRTAWRMAGIGFLASLAQAVTAIVLVYAGLGVLALSSGAIIGTTERLLVPISFAAMVGIGIWIAWRGVRMVRHAAATERGAHHHHGHTCSGHHHDDGAHDQDHDHGHQHHHDHSHSHHAHSSECAAGCKHMPTAEEVDRIGSWRDVLALIVAIGIRPCSGALIVLVIAWRFGLYGTGAASAFAMAVGTGIVVATVAIAATALRQMDLGGNGSGALSTSVAGGIQAIAGLLIALLCAVLLAGSLATPASTGLLR